jgi:hypothetical protein
MVIYLSVSRVNNSPPLFKTSYCRDLIHPTVWYNNKLQCRHFTYYYYYKKATIKKHLLAGSSYFIAGTRYIQRWSDRTIATIEYNMAFTSALFWSFRILRNQIWFNEGFTLIIFDFSDLYVFRLGFISSIFQFIWD